MATQPLITALSAGIRTVPCLCRNWKKKPPSGKSSQKKLPRDDNHKRSSSMTTFPLFVLYALLVLFPSPLSAQAGKPTTISELVTYSGKDREQLLYAGAKTE